MPYKGNMSDGGGKQRVSQATIASIKKMGMTAALKKAGTSGNGEFVEGIRRMYGAKRLAAAQKSASISSRPRGARGFGPATSSKSASKSAPAAQKPSAAQIAAAKARAGGNASVYSPGTVKKTASTSAKYTSPAAKKAAAAAVKRAGGRTA
jgi:hypothetical protein